MPLQNDIQNNSLELNSCSQNVTHSKRNVMHMTGYILIRRNFLCDSALLDLALFPVYLKLAHR